MEILTKKDNKIIFRDTEFDFVSTEKLDDNTIHLITDSNVFCIVVNDTELNGVVYNNSDELIAELNK